MTFSTVEQYEIREPKVGDIPGFFDLLQKPSAEITEQLIRHTVFKDGAPVGDAISEIPVRLIFRITNEVVKAAGLGDLGNA